MFELVFSRRFSMAHRLLAGSSERCALPHGHNEYVRVHLRATAPAALDGQANMVLPFQRAKGVWHAFIDGHVDHALQLGEDDPLLPWFRQHEPRRAARILVTPGDPTTELLACLLMAKLNAFLAADGGALTCAAIEIEETPTNTVRYTGDPLAVLPQPRPAARCWWRRADTTIADT
ncbi:6-carboxytetrahydropterin synthase [Komagataeibacter sp. AV436]|uniref:6-carboxy-5,6,7,8-tetrahydropterin synthase n=1 Tax=Komagataeibacter melomenusus TaxID=2766578 RepID=A0ABX2AEA2_9PROT|nr:6-carboxytetrahydropterin synthase [Komagataeibacter melomenusus]MBV1830483.1 6-carboxytetrahydropterin synthase [Komagataeibacter melomenusus]NPC66535.1 6-carboxytetrahydropterin synthase [Komagataeibacter melomenusus]